MHGRAHKPAGALIGQPRRGRDRARRPWSGGRGAAHRPRRRRQRQRHRPPALSPSIVTAGPLRAIGRCGRHALAIGESGSARRRAPASWKASAASHGEAGDLRLALEGVRDAGALAREQLLRAERGGGAVEACGVAPSSARWRSMKPVSNSPAGTPARGRARRESRALLRGPSDDGACRARRRAGRAPRSRVSPCAISLAIIGS